MTGVMVEDTHRATRQERERETFWQTASWRKCFFVFKLLWRRFCSQVLNIASWGEAMEEAAAVFEYHKEEDTVDVESFQGQSIRICVIRLVCFDTILTRTYIKIHISGWTHSSCPYWKKFDNWILLYGIAYLLWLIQTAEVSNQLSFKMTTAAVLSVLGQIPQITPHVYLHIRQTQSHTKANICVLLMRKHIVVAF